MLFFRAGRGLNVILPSLISLKKASEQILPARAHKLYWVLNRRGRHLEFPMTLPQDIPPDDIGKLQSQMNAAVKAHWKAFLFEGIVLALLGLAAMIVPPLASLAVTIFLGWMFLISGIAGLFATYWARQMPGFWWSLFSAALAVLAGGILLAKPEQGILTLTIVVGAYFLAEGVVTIMYALEHRRELSERWSWLLISGAMDLLIAFIIVAGLPDSAQWAIGLLVGINLVLGGASMVGMALAARKS
jgi:uncharacterized membrane protein HdeD (DUF308 family)